jgi:hypothetical protein
MGAPGIPFFSEVVDVKGKQTSSLPSALKEGSGDQHSSSSSISFLELTSENSGVGEVGEIDGIFVVQCGMSMVL